MITEDVILIVKRAKVLVVSNENSELYRFGNKSMLAYFVVQEIISKYREIKDSSELESIINKSCINICTDILLFVIFQTDDTSILKNILSFISKTINNDMSWKELDIHNNIPNFLKNPIKVDNETNRININEEKIKLDQAEEEAEEAMVNEFEIKDIYDWDDSVIEEFNNKLIRMASLLYIISKSLPCFEHKLRIDEKKQLVEYLYRLPNMIFMFWAKAIDETYDDLIEELKLNPYLCSKKYKKADSKQLDTKIQELFSMYSINLLLNLYYIPVINATGKNTYKYLNNIDFFDFSQSITHKLENLMILEQLTHNDEFVKSSIKMKDEFTDYISTSMLSLIVKHEIITRNDKRENAEKLESKFFPQAQKPLLIERAKNKSLKR